MEPRIQYAKTKDGVSIAYAAVGEGTPFVLMPSMPWSHIQLEWQFPEHRNWYERLAEKRMLVRYDSRGSGMSERSVTDWSLDALVLDLEAIVNRLALERFALMAPHHAGPVAVAYAARHAERVSHLILWCVWIRPSDWSGFSEFRALRGTLDINWEMFTQALAHVTVGWSEGERASRFATLIRESVTPEMMRMAWEAGLEIDATDFLPQVRSPTLVLQRRQVPWLDVGVAGRLASQIPDARLIVLEGTSLNPSQDDTEAVLAAIDEFLGEGEEASAAGVREAGAFRTVLFTDVEGSTALTQRLGDAKARELLREHERMVREALKSHGGSEVKTMGDGFMASFSSATKALECAIAMQRAFAEHNESADEPILVRVGLNAGEPIAEEDDLFGTAVNLAARICSHADAGQILAPIVVRELAAGKQFMFADLGETELRGFEDPVRMYEVKWQR
jgi:class 3 adenylate cyclase